MKKVTGSGASATVFVYDIRGRMVAEYASAPPQQNGTRYLTADHLGTPRVVTDAAGAVKARRDFLPFGEEIGQYTGGRDTVAGYGADGGLRQKFTGKERDAETGLDYFLARYYSPGHGRFTSPDEFTGGPDEFYEFDELAQNPTFYADLADPQSLNKYAYCYNNPLLYTDPDGHQGIREYARRAAEAAKGFGKGVTASLTFGAIPGTTPAAGDTNWDRAGQIVGTVAVAATGVSLIGGGGTITIGTGGAAAVVGVPAAAVGGVATAGAAVNGARLATAPAPIRMSNNSDGNGGGEYKPKEGRDTKNKTPREAFREAKRKSGVPTSQTHDTHRKIKDRTVPGKTVVEYDFRRRGPGGRAETKTIPNHRNGHPKGKVPRHFNDTKGGHHEY